jgi:hypothetical protein
MNIYTWPQNFFSSSPTIIFPNNFVVLKRWKKKKDLDAFFVSVLLRLGKKKSLMRAVSRLFCYTWVGPLWSFAAHLSFSVISFQGEDSRHFGFAFPRTQPSLGNVPDSVVVCVRAKRKRNHTTLAKELREIKSWPDLSWQTWRLKLQSDIHVCTRQHSWDSDPIPVDPTPSSAGCVPLHTYVRVRSPTDGHFDGVSTKVD